MSNCALGTQLNLKLFATYWERPRSHKKFAHKKFGGDRDKLWATHLFLQATLDKILGKKSKVKFKE